MRKRGGGDQGSLYEHLSQIVKFGLLLHWQLGQLQSKREGVRNPIRRRQTHYFVLLLSKSTQRNSFPYVLLYLSGSLLLLPLLIWSGDIFFFFSFSFEMSYLKLFCMHSAMYSSSSLWEERGSNVT